MLLLSCWSSWLAPTAQEVVTTHITEIDHGHTSVPHHKTTAAAPHGTDGVHHPQIIVIITTITIGTIATVAIAAAVGMIDITAHQDITTTDTTPLVTDTTIIITMVAAVVVVIIITIIKNIMISLLVVGENPELLFYFIL